MQCRASMVPRERSVRYPRHPGGSEVHYKGEICVHYWRMVSNMVRCTRWKVITIIYDKRDPYTQWYTHAQPLWQIWVNKSYSAKYPIWVNTSNIEQGQVWSCCLFWVNDSYIRFGLPSVRRMDQTCIWVINSYWTFWTIWIINSNLSKVADEFLTHIVQNWLRGCVP